MSADLYLGLTGLEILLPATGCSLSESDTEISRESRTASGRLVRDAITVKKKFEVNYSILEDSEFQKIIDLYALKKDLSLRLSNKDGSQRSYTVKMSPFARKRFVVGDIWYWQDVKVELEEI